jgi:hypothetical protein
MLENEDGTDFLPVRLATVLIIASLVLVSAAVYATEVGGQASKAAARDCASKIVAIAAAEYAESCPGQGSGALADVAVPGIVCRMTFGLEPAGSPAEGTGTYSIRYVDGSDEIYLSGVPLGSGSPPSVRGGPLVLYPGRYSIRIRTEEVDGRLMALLYVEGK